jgi:hypothetical protein
VAVILRDARGPMKILNLIFVSIITSPATAIPTSGDVSHVSTAVGTVVAAYDNLVSVLS